MDTATGKRRRLASSENETREFGRQASIPPPLYDLDRLESHIDLETFGKGLQQAVNAVFPNNSRCKYKEIHALLLSWEDEDPKLPVSIEVAELLAVFGSLYGFETEAWQIPSKDSHRMTNKKIDDFLGVDDPEILKIVYYAGHGRLTSNGQSAWTSRRNKLHERCPMVKWSGIQNMLEEANSDVLILLDCCASGCVNTDEGAGVTELLAACAFNGEANGVGPFSFSRALITQLRHLNSFPSFTTGVLFNRLYAEIQGWRFIGEKLQKPPVHLLLTQDHRLPRSIQLCRQVKDKVVPSELVNLVDTPNKDTQNSDQGQTSPSHGSNFSAPEAIWSSPKTSESSNSAPPCTDPAAFPRLLFSIRLQEDVKGKNLSEDLFKDWLRMISVLAGKIRVEAGFASDSTLILLSLPAALLRYLPQDPAIQLVGLIRSYNLLIKSSKEPAIPIRSTLPKSLNNSQVTPLHKGPGAVSSVPIRQSKSPQVLDPQGKPSYQQRMQSHNLIERRRRDAINERCYQLGQLVPNRRLDEERLRIRLQSGKVLNESELAGISQSSRLGRPADKSEILNATVSWTRDLMWMLNEVLQQETKLAETITELGGNFPFEPTENEKRMASEFVDVANQNDVQNFHYSRSAGSSTGIAEQVDDAGSQPRNSEWGEKQAQSSTPLSHWQIRLTPAATVSTNRSSVDTPDLRSLWTDLRSVRWQDLSPPRSPAPNVSPYYQQPTVEDIEEEPDISSGEHN